MKRIPVYLSESELDYILDWYKTHNFECGSDDTELKLAERLEEESATFEE